MARAPTGQVIERRGQRGTTYALRFRAYGKRRYVTLGTVEEGWSRDRAETELQNVLADVRRGMWREPDPVPLIEEPEHEPTFHVYSSEWVARREHEVDERTSEHWRWALSSHLLSVFADYRPSQITGRMVDAYKVEKLRQRDELAAEPGPRRGLSNSSINKTLKVLAQILDDAIEDGFLTENPARGKRRRLKAAKPRRTWLELDEVRALLKAAGKRRTLLATMILAGLRVGELTALRWREVDLARGKLSVHNSKTDAGVREIDLSPDLREELTVYRAGARDASPDMLVFPTGRGTPLHRANISNRILADAIEAANAKLAEVGQPPIEGVTNHSLRRTFASLLYEAGASPAYVMAQMGHASSALALEVYAKKMERSRDTGARMDALIRGAGWEAEALEPKLVQISRK